jgi:uncharacterized membrane protein
MENYDDDQTSTLKFDKGSRKLVTMLALLIVICSIVIVSVIIYAPRSEGYNEMYLINIQSQTGDNSPQSFIVKQNSVFDAQIAVENHKPTLGNYQVQVKIVEDTFSFPIDTIAYKTFEFALDPEQVRNYQVPVVLAEKGDFSIVFELFAEKEGVYRFTDIYCVLHVTVI